MSTNTIDAAASTTRKCLTFGLGGETYGIDILKVREIIGMMRITRVPQMPEFVRGVINLRGRIIPVVDLRVRFGSLAIQDTDRTCVIIVQVERDDSPVTVGLIVEEVADVVDLPEGAVEPVPEFGSGVEASFLLGMGKIDDLVVMLLDIDAVLSADELEVISELG